MGQLLACMTTRADLLQAAVAAETARLGLPPEKVDGWGVGFFHAGEVLHKKRPMFGDEQLAWPALFEDLDSSVAIAHVRESTHGSASADNTHPFRMRQWLFAHIGSIAGFDQLRGGILDALPDFLQRNIRGDTDSEYLFHLILSFVHDAAQLDVNDPEETVVLDALRRTVTLLDKLASEVGVPEAQLNLALTNGRDLYLMRRGLPMHYVERDTLDTLEAVPEGRSTSPIRYIMAVTRTRGEPPEGYTELPEGHILRIDRTLGLHEHSLG